jgi:hypothetical protein
METKKIYAWLEQKKGPDNRVDYGQRKAAAAA